jgi:hypothetical protein
MIDSFKLALGVVVCIFFSFGCASIASHHSVMRIEQSGDGQLSLDAFKTNLATVLAKYKIDPKYAAPKATAPSGSLEYYFHADYPNILQVFGEAASIPVVKSGLEGVTMKVVAGVISPTCNGNTTCYSTTICGANPPQCYKKKSCNACP